MHTQTAFALGNNYWFASLEYFARDNDYGLTQAGRFINIANQEVVVLTENRQGAKPLVFMFESNDYFQDSYKRVV